MVDNQHKQIEGFRDLQPDEIELMNEIKYAEITTADLWKNVVAVNEIDSFAATVDMHWANIAKIHFQEGFSALVRSIAKPKDPFKWGESPIKPVDIPHDAADDLNNLVND